MTPEQITEVIATLRAARSSSGGNYALRSAFGQLPQDQKRPVYEALPADLRMMIDTRTLPNE